MVCRDNFPLPTLGPKLVRIRRDLYEGRGFGVIRGIDSKSHPVENLAVVHLGLQSYIANRHGRQDKKGNMMGMTPGPSSTLNAFLELTSETVHIIADNSSKLKAEHHRHSTAPIVR